MGYIYAVERLSDDPVPGKFLNKINEWKFGFNPDISTSEETVWDHGGLYSYLAAASVLSVSSANVNDTALGSGARTVQIHGLDAKGFLALQLMAGDATESLGAE